MNAMSVRIAVVFLHISFKNKNQTCFVSKRSCHDVFELIKTLENSRFFTGKKVESRIPRSTRRSRMIVISQSGVHAIALFFF
jgi:hypothetical protein